MTVGDDAGSQRAGSIQLPSIQEPSPVGGHQTSWRRLIYLFSSPPRDLFISCPVLKPNVHPEECLLKPFGLEKGSLPLIALFCSVLASWWVIRGSFGLLLSPCWISKLPSAAPGCPTLWRIDSWRGRSFPFQSVLPESQLLELVCRSPTWALNKAGWVSLMASPGTYDIMRVSLMEPRFGEFTEQPLTNKQANQCWLLALLLYLFICQIHYRKQLLLFLKKGCFNSQ